MKSQSDKLYIVLISVHGLIRGEDLELGRDADTGGQIKYVVELARALALHPRVGRVDILTRRIVSKQVSKDYSRKIEPLSDKANVIRIDCGEAGYLPKEALWDSLDNFADNALYYISHQKRLPDVIHSHYADAGYVGTRLSHQLSIPLIYTGHSLGRTKRKRLLASGVKGAVIEQRYNMSRRIEAEEATLGVAERVITSTHQEIEQQYELYDYYQPDQMRVVPPGADLEKFFPPTGGEHKSNIYRELGRFLKTPDKSIILALSRPDQRKNIVTLVEAYGESSALQEVANLVLITGNRDDIHDMDAGAQEVMTDILLAVDRYDLYGRVAYPKHHSADEVPLIYRLAARSRGVFVNPALTEPFGLTLLEAAACGLPVVATEDGGPVDIIGNCRNGYLINPLDKNAITDTLLEVLSNEREWTRFAKNGLEGVRRHYSWEAHVEKYLSVIQPVIDKSEPLTRMRVARRPMLYHDRVIFSDLDQSLIGDEKSLARFVDLIKGNSRCTSFGIATGRRLDSALKLLRAYNVPHPHVLITSLGTEIYYAPDLTKDAVWEEHIDHLWNPKAVQRVLSDVSGIALQPKEEQSKFKLSYYYDSSKAPEAHEINQLLLQNDQTVNVVLSFGQYLDVTPVRASKGLALRWVADQWDIPLDRILAAGGSGADEDMMRGNTLAVVVANRHHEELSGLEDIERIYFANKPYAEGIMEAIRHYDFFGSCEVSRE
ncbi:MAG: HAD-IIB family hydrolase [Gammaproteobacteria bacterium]|nr:HAD-IIB family hydrolase [Gammaproteobacteria bacterium]